MLKLKRIVLVAITLVVLASTASADVNFSRVVCFGDSLTNNEILWLAYNRPPEIYGKDPVEAMFSKARSSSSELKSYAVAGSESKRLPAQISAYRLQLLLGNQEAATLINIEAGGNDILNNRFTLKDFAPGQSARADAIVTLVKENIRDAWKTLHNLHPNAKIIIWTVPDITSIPKCLTSFSDAEDTNLRAHTARVNQYIRSLQRQPFITVVDVYETLRGFVSQPPVIGGATLQGPPANGTADCLFADRIHPTEVGNALLANAIIKRINSKWGGTVKPYTTRELSAMIEGGGTSSVPSVSP